MSSEAFINVLEQDLRLLSSEARKSDGFQLTGLFHHNDSPNIKDLVEKTLQRLRQHQRDRTSLQIVKNDKEILRPFACACEFKNSRLVSIALSSFQKLLANDAISGDGRTDVIAALQNAEKINEEGVKLRILQTSLSLLQNANHADDEAGICKLLSLVFRIYTSSKASPTVLSTAAATIRQAVALVFDHSIAPVAAPSSHDGSGDGAEPPGSTGRHAYGDMLGREAAALHLLQDVVVFCSGVKDPQTWLLCPAPPRTLMLDLLEGILLFRAPVFHCLPQLTVCLRQKVCLLVEGLVRSALDPELDTASMVDVRLVLRAAGAILRRHTALAPDKCAVLLQMLIRGVGPGIMPWQRILVLQVVHSMARDHLLMYRLFEFYDLRMDFDLNAVNDLVKALHDIIRSFCKLAGEVPEDDIVSSLASLYARKASGADIIMDLDQLLGQPVFDGAEILITYLALESLLAIVADVEVLTDTVVDSRASGTPSAAAAVAAAGGPGGSTSGGSHALAALHHTSLASTLASGSSATSMMSSHSSALPPGAVPSRRRPPGPSPSLLPLGPVGPTLDDVQSDLCGNLVDMVWRHVQSALAALLSRTTSEALVLTLLRGYQSYTYSAGALGVITARDGCLQSLCEFTLMSPEDPLIIQAEAAAVAAREAERGNSNFSEVGNRASLLNTTALRGKDGLVLSAKNMAALRTLFNLAHRLCDVLGHSWVYVVDVTNSLDSALLSPHTTTQDPQRELEVLLSGGGGGAPVGAPSDLTILGSAVNQLFETTNRMSTDAVVSLLSVLSEISMRSLPKQASMSGQRLHALSRMVDVLLHNLFRIQDLWGIFLAHLLEILTSSNAQVRTAAIDALNRCITGALDPAACSTSGPESFARHTQQQVPPEHTSASTSTSEQQHQQHQPVVGVAPGVGEADGPDGCQWASRAEDVQNMLLVALDSLYREDRELDVRRGLLRVVWNVLQHHGERLTRGWVPVLRLLEAVPKWQDPGTIALGFQCLEMIGSDFLPFLPKEHIPKALELITLFAEQRVILNVSLTAVTMIWNIADLLARSKTLKPAAGGTDKGAVVSASGRYDLTDAECIMMLMIAFRSLGAVSVDTRPEVRNSSVRTLFLAVGSHGAKFGDATWRDCMWGVLLPLIHRVFHMSETSSAEEAQAVELGKDRGGKKVVMLMHHSRNSEQKQWEETLVLALHGAAKVLRAHLGSLATLDGFEESWTELMQVLGCVVGGARKGVANAGINLLTTLLQSHGQSANFKPWMWRQALAAMDLGVRVMATPSTPAALQTRTELLLGMSAMYATLKTQLTADDVRILLHWLSRFARYPFGIDDISSLHATGVLPIQKNVLSILTQLVPVQVPEVWPDILRMLVDMLCPFELMAIRQQHPAAGSALGSALGSAGTASSPLGGQSLRNGSSAFDSDGTGASPRATTSRVTPTPSQSDLASTSFLSGAAGTAAPHVERVDAVVEARALSSAWMNRIAELLATFYCQHATVQVRVALLPEVLRCLADCMATRHTDPGAELWQTAARAFCAVVQAGLPAMNRLSTRDGGGSDAAQVLAHVARTSPSVPPTLAGLHQDTWQALARAFQMFFLQDGLPLAAQIAISSAAAASPAVAPPPSAPSDAASASRAAAVGEVQAAVLDCLADAVLPGSCHASASIRTALVSVVDAACESAGQQSQEDMAATGSGSARLSHACLSKLYVLCSRGAGVAGPAAAAAQQQQQAACSNVDLEVAQLALPRFISRCEATLLDYLSTSTSTSDPAASSANSHGEAGHSQTSDQQQQQHEVVALAERTAHVLDLLTQLTLAPAVMDSLVPLRPTVQPWLQISRATAKTQGGSLSRSGSRGVSGTGEGDGARGSRAHSGPGSAGTGRGRMSESAGGTPEQREKTHLLLLYSTLCRCISLQERRLRDSIAVLLQQVGLQIGLISELS